MTGYKEKYKEYLNGLFPKGRCEAFEKCTHEDKDDYYCHDFCPYVLSYDDFVRELEEMMKKCSVTTVEKN